jgi:excisionase family DNA binding protein
MMRQVPPLLSPHKPHEWPAILTTTQVASLLSISDQTVRTLIDRCELPATRVGKPWRIAAEDVWPFVPPGIRATWPAGPWRDQPSATS